MNSLYFCCIEDEQKAFEIIKQYHEIIKNADPNDESTELNKFDNIIQAHEIQNHLSLNNINKENETHEKVNWALKYGHSFRVYLNTLKVILLILEASSIDVDSMTYEQFNDIRCKLNLHNALLDIHK